MVYINTCIGNLAKILIVYLHWLVVEFFLSEKCFKFGVEKGRTQFINSIAKCKMAHEN